MYYTCNYLKLIEFQGKETFLFQIYIFITSSGILRA